MAGDQSRRRRGANPPDYSDPGAGPSNAIAPASEGAIAAEAEEDAAAAAAAPQAARAQASSQQLRVHFGEHRSPVRADPSGAAAAASAGMAGAAAAIPPAAAQAPGNIALGAARVSAMLQGLVNSDDRTTRDLAALRAQVQMMQEVYSRQPPPSAISAPLVSQMPTVTAQAPPPAAPLVVPATAPQAAAAAPFPAAPPAPAPVLQAAAPAVAASSAAAPGGGMDIATLMRTSALAANIASKPDSASAKHKRNARVAFEAMDMGMEELKAGNTAGAMIKLGYARNALKLYLVASSERVLQPDFNAEYQKSVGEQILKAEEKKAEKASGDSRQGGGGGGGRDYRGGGGRDYHGYNGYNGGGGGGNKRPR
ncbi:hypothetical protein GPECTOR_2270g1205 [Gonium pectorale]|uniref:Uncharacterized protein n=1 Tax=Gonium pectorale TaxID=33097 RepID=A0A150FT69_GONPE|nr:hypothetical protein GPECTOR_2270g1205 [Gonium pectorale]|eukprot:KXZ40804.1 hypothetical protein GPECTOR_2270g1205 [Gonium pectorale]